MTSRTASSPVNGRAESSSFGCDSSLLRLDRLEEGALEDVLEECERTDGLAGGGCTLCFGFLVGDTWERLPLSVLP